MKIGLMDKCESEIRPLIEEFTKTTSFWDYFQISKDKYFRARCQCEIHCDNSLGFYDDIDVLCGIGLAGNEHLCPYIQDKFEIDIPGYDKEAIREVIKKYEQQSIQETNQGKDTGNS